MHIDWLTVSAQIVNFLILVWLLQRFLYGPVVRAMDRREARIRERLEEAAQTRAQAAQEAQAYRERQAALERQRDQFLGEAREQAAQAHGRMRQQALEQVEEQRRHWQQQLQDERAEFLSALRERAVEQFIALARRALADLADAELERQMVGRFMARLEAVDDAVRGQIGRATELRIRTRDPLPAAARQDLTQALGAWLGKAPTLRFECDPNAPWGIELQAASRIVAWTLEGYLDDYAAALAQPLDAAAPRA